MKIPAWTVPVLIVGLIVAGLGAARLLAIPTVTIDYADGSPLPQLDTLVLIVDGVRCADTARTAASTLEDLPGVLHFTAFASYNRVEIDFDPAITDRESIVAAIEGPVYDPETGEFRFAMFSVVDQNQK
jgi:hypothetical protein